MVYRHHFGLILRSLIISNQCTLGCLDISSDIQCAVFKEQCIQKRFTFLFDWLSSHQVRKCWLVTAYYAVTVRTLLESLFLSHRCSAYMSSVQGNNPVRGNFGRLCNLPCIYIKLDIFHLIRQPPILPYRYQYSIVGRSGLNRRVRDGNGCFP